MGAGYSSQQAPGNPDFQLELTLKATINTVDILTTAETAGKAILNIYNSDNSKWEVQLKSDSSPLTIADREAHRVISENLQRLTPHIPILSEEGAQTPYEIRQGYQYYWLVDPLDGTKEFLKRNGEFTVNIALIHAGAPVLGVVHVPCQDTTYWAVQGQGAWKRSQGKTSPIHAAKFKLDAPGLTIVGSSSHMSAETKEFMDLFAEPKQLQVGSSLKLLMVAEGSAHIYPRMAPTCEWDTAAADIIVREAGGVVLQAGSCDKDGKPLEDWKEALMKEQRMVYNKPNLLNPYFVVFGQKDGAGGLGGRV